MEFQPNVIVLLSRAVKQQAGNEIVSNALRQSVVVDSQGSKMRSNAASLLDNLTVQLERERTQKAQLMDQMRKLEADTLEN